MRSVVLSTVAFCVVLSGLASGQDDAPSSHYEHMKGLECFIGDWISEGRVPDDATERAGERYRGRTTVRWIIGKNVQEWHWRTRIGGEVFYEGKAFFYFDAETQQMKTFNVGLRGGHWSGTLTKEGEKWVERHSGVTPERKKTSGVTTYRMDGDTMMLDLTEQRIGDESAPDMTLECKRVKPKTSAAYKHLRFLEPLVGNWGVVTKEDDKVVSDGQEASEWILNKSFMKHTGWGQHEGEHVEYEFITGWNPKTEEVFQWAIGATDSDYGITWRNGNYSRAKRAWSSQGRLLLGDGQERTGQVHLKVVDKDTVTIDFLQNRSGNEALPDAFDTFKRAAKVTPPPLDKTPGPGFEQLKFLDFSVGKWKLEATTPKYIGEEVNEWAYDKNFMRTTGWGKLENEERVDYEFVMGWNPEKKKVFARFIASDGSIATREGTYDAESNCLTSKQVMVDALGIESVGTAVEQYVNDDRFLLKFSDTMKGGKPEPDVSVTATRIRP